MAPPTASSPPWASIAANTPLDSSSSGNTSPSASRLGILGFFLIAPLFVWAFEKLLGPIVAALLGLRYTLLKQQLSSGLCAGRHRAPRMMVGLAVLIVLQTEGKTAIGGWKLPDKFPDIFIVNFTGIDLSEALAKLEDVPGIRKGEVMPDRHRLPRPARQLPRHSPASC